MTVRAKSKLSKSLSDPAQISAIWAKSTVVGELQVQVMNREGKMETVFIPSSAGSSRPRLVNLLEYATPTEWRKSRSLMAAVRAGHLTVTIDR